MKYKIGDKVIINNDVSAVYSIIATDYVSLYRIGKAGKHIKWMKEEDLSPAGNLVDSEEATEEFKEKLDSGYFDESDEQLLDAMDEYPEGLKDEDTPHWEDSSNGWMCSKCKQDSTHDTEYCPHCHAKMANGVKDKKDELLLSEEEINNLLKALQNDDLTKKVYDMLSNKSEKHQSEINPDDVCYKAGYEQGYQEAKTEFYENRYQEGLQDAWELAQKIAKMSTVDLDNIGFLVDKEWSSVQNAITVITLNSATEALEKIKAYEQRLGVGDEVINKTITKCKPHVITQIRAEWVGVLSENGYPLTWEKKKVVKTGKHYDIQSILDGLKED